MLRAARGSYWEGMHGKTRAPDGVSRTRYRPRSMPYAEDLNADADADVDARSTCWNFICHGLYFAGIWIPPPHNVISRRSLSPDRWPTRTS